MFNKKDNGNHKYHEVESTMSFKYNLESLAFNLHKIYLKPINYNTLLMKNHQNNYPLNGLFTVLFLVFVMAFCSCKRVSDKYEIKAKISGLDSFDKAYIQVLSDTGFCYIDSVNIQKTEFQFVGKLDEPTHVTLWIKDKTTLRLSPLCSSFYLENSKITISGDIKNRGKINVEGSDAERTWKKLEKYAYSSQEATNLYIKINTDSNLDSIAKWRKQLEIKNEKHKQGLVKAIKNNSSSYIALHVLLRNKSTFSLNELKDLANCFPVEMHSSNSYKSLLKILNDKPAVRIGDKFMDFSLFDLKHQKVTRSQFKSKLLMIDFWASWCGPCRRQFKSIKEIYAQTKRSDFEIIGISVDEDPTKWQQALENERVPWLNTIVPDKEWAKSNFLISGIPYNFILDSNRIVLAKDLAPVEIKDFIRKYCN